MRRIDSLIRIFPFRGCVSYVVVPYLGMVLALIPSCIPIFCVVSYLRVVFSYKFLSLAFLKLGPYPNCWVTQFYV